MPKLARPVGVGQVGKCVGHLLNCGSGELEPNPALFSQDTFSNNPRLPRVNVVSAGHAPEAEGKRAGTYIYHPLYPGLHAVVEETCLR